MTGCQWPAREVVSDRYVILRLGSARIQIAFLKRNRRALSRTR